MGTSNANGARAATHLSYRAGYHPTVAPRQPPNPQLRHHPPIWRLARRRPCPRPLSFPQYLRRRQPIDSLLRAAISRGLPAQVALIAPAWAVLYQVMSLRHRVAAGRLHSEWRDPRPPAFLSSVFSLVPLPTVHEKPSALSTSKGLQASRLKRFSSA